MVGPRFRDFIARWEMNIEPPPVEKIEKYVLLYALNSDRILMSPPRPATPQRWGHTRLHAAFCWDDLVRDAAILPNEPHTARMLRPKRRCLTERERAPSPVSL